MGPVRARHPHAPIPGSSFALSLALFEPRPAACGCAPQLIPPNLRLNDRTALSTTTTAAGDDQGARIF